jgi:hypothetical protein
MTEGGPEPPDAERCLAEYRAASRSAEEIELEARMAEFERKKQEWDAQQGKKKLSAAEEEVGVGQGRVREGERDGLGGGKLVEGTCVRLTTLPCWRSVVVPDSGSCLLLVLRDSCSRLLCSAAQPPPFSSSL